MRLRLKVLGMAYRRLELGKGFGDCYKLYKEARRNIRSIELFEDENSIKDLPDVFICLFNQDK